MSAEKRNTDTFVFKPLEVRNYDLKEENAIDESKKKLKRTYFSWIFEKRTHDQIGFINKQMPFIWNGK